MRRNRPSSQEPFSSLVCFECQLIILHHACSTEMILFVGYLPDSSKAQASLKFLLESLSTDDKLKQDLLNSIDTSCSCAEVLKAKVMSVWGGDSTSSVDSFLRCLQVEVVGKVGSKSIVLEIVRNMLDRACPMLIDAKCVETLVIKV